MSFDPNSKTFSFCQGINKFCYIFLTILILKIILAGLFSSDYQNNLFIPFVNIFLSGNYNPWDFVWSNNLKIEFPYHPLMLYIQSFGMLLIKIFHVKSLFLTNLLFKIPTIVADVGIFYLLLKNFKEHPYRVISCYFLSPIIIYASYMHSQLDLVPVSLLFWAYYCLKESKIFKAAAIFALSICVKFTSILILPILFAYVIKHYKLSKILKFTAIIAGIYLGMSLPFVFTPGYQYMVLLNGKQDLFFNLTLKMGDIAVFVPLCVTLLIYLRFFSYKRVNVELLDSYIILTLAVILVFIPPSTPAWYIWLIPFLNIFVIKYFRKNKTSITAYILLNIAYLVYFLVFHIGDYSDLQILSIPIDFKIHDIFLKNAVFTTLEAVLIANIYMVYKIGMKSNRVYKQNRAIVIGIGGDSGSGKSSLLKRLNTLFGNNILAMEGDGSHKWERESENWKVYTPLDPKANYLYTQMTKILKLKRFESVYHCEYNHSTGKFDAPIRIEPKPFVILSGLHPFYLPKMRKIIDLKIYLKPDENLRKYWKIKRDVAERGYSVEKVIESITNRQADSKKYIEPQKNFADLIIELYPQDEFDFTNVNQFPELNLKMTFNSSFDLENLIRFLNENSIKHIWDYSEDLSNQYLILSETDLGGGIDLNVLLKSTTENFNELTKNDITLSPGLNGIIEYVILKLMSERLKELYDV